MKWKKFFLPLLVFLVALGGSFFIIKSEEKPELIERKNPVTAVDVKRLKRQAFQITIHTQGTVKPRTESTLIPEVAGRIIKTSPKFREGAFFEAGEELLRIDDSNYQIAVTVARAKLSEEQLALAEENALAEQAIRNWQRLGKTTPPTDLVLHKPQLARAKAAVASARALLKQAQLDLKRAQILAPYAGRVLEQQVDIGQYVSPGTVLAKIYAVDYAEIRLPLSNRQLEFVDIPESYRGEIHSPDQNTEVTLTVKLGNQKHQWMGYIVRAEGTYDVRSRRLFVVAQVDNPYGQQDPKKPPLKVGQFVEAQIKGRLLDKVFVIPRAAVRENSEILLIDKQNKIQTRRVKAIWEDDQTMVISEGIEQGELLCLTPITFAAQGLTVKPMLDGKPLFSSDSAKANAKLKVSNEKGL
jgi:RND family efflux transporter MFP subunit